MTLATNITSLATRVASECKSLRTLVNGNAADLSSLTTTAKSNLVAAINELQSAISSQAAATTIDDSAPSGSKTYSSSKIDNQIAAAVAALVNGAPAALDTLAELATQLAADEGIINGLTSAIGNRVRFDAAQTLTAPQKAQALSNIAAAALVHVHTISDVTGLQGALDAKQPIDPTLTALASISTAADQLIYAAGSDIFTTTAITAFARSLIAATNAAAARLALGLGSASTADASAFQASNALLSAIAAVVSSADKLIYLTGSNTVSTVTLTAFVRTLLDDVDAVSVRSTLGLGSAATYAASAFAGATHTHVIGDVAALQTALDAKALAVDVGDTTTNFVNAFTNGLV